MADLQFSFKIIDQATKPLAAIQRALGAVGKAVRSAGAGGAFGKMFSGIASGASKAASGIAKFATSMPALLGAGAVGGIAAMGAKFVYDSLSFKENALIAFKAVTGSAAEGEKAYDMAVKFAAVTPMATDEVVTSFKELMTAGFQLEELPTVMAGLGDIQSLFGNEGMDSALRVMKKAMMNGKIQGEDLEGLGRGGVASDKLWATLSAQLGVTPEQAHEMAVKGSVAKRDLIKGILSTVQAIGGEPGRALGGAMDEKSKTLEGLFSSLTSRPFELITEAATGKGMGGIKKFVANMTAALDPSGPTGKRIMAFFTKVADGVGKFFGDMSGPDKMTDTLGRIVGICESVVGALGGMASGFLSSFGGVSSLLGPAQTSLNGLNAAASSGAVNWKEFGRALGDAANAVILVVNAAKDLASLGSDNPLTRWVGQQYFEILDKGADTDAMKDSTAKLEAQMREMGMSAGNGLVAGLEGKRGLVGSTTAALGDDIVRSMRDQLEIRSPSRVMMGLGEYTADGFDIGLRRGGLGGFDLPTVSMPSGASGGASGSRGVNVGDVNVTINAGSADAAQTLEVFRTGIRSQVVALFEEAALEMGAAT